MASRVLALCNQKGGVGKTTTTFNLARAAVRAGLRVLVVDLDPQGNLTAIATARNLPRDAEGVADVLSGSGGVGVAEVTVAGVWDGLQVVPTVGTGLGHVRDQLVAAGIGRERRLASALAPVRDEYDLVLIDCPPSLDQLTINALVAADEVLVVTHSKLFSADGLAHLLDTIDAIKANYHPQLRVGGVIVNQHEEHTVSGRKWAAEIGSAMPVLHPPIPKRAVIGDAAEAATGLDEWHGTGRAGAAALADIYTGYLTALNLTEGTPA